ncbi:MAG: hypothetical protein J6S98_10690 [Lentisphaeria bacterium]|jgi:drug/metabolite transporter (DMT)-like permease|nr:hypothetical protein [Lentisphaeria bacterium]MBO5958812.1 hypothetical protein [Lentisphaeria bacterium]
MSLIAFVLIIVSAVLHASWNLLAKKSQMTVPFYTIICTVCALMWIHVQFWTPVNLTDLPCAFWLYLAGSLASDLLYCFGLIYAYRTMEMSTVYPVMRSLPLLLTALLTALFGWGKPLTPFAVTGMVVVFCGCMIMPLKKFGDFSFRNYLNRNFLFTFVVALGTTGYTVFDSQSLAVFRGTFPDLSKPVVALTYYSTRCTALALSLWLLILFRSADRAAVKEYWKNRNFAPVYAGFAACMCYVLVLLAMNYVTNVSFVQAFRQIGLVLGMAGGFIFLKEKCTLTKIVGIILILSGLAITIIR